VQLVVTGACSALGQALLRTLAARGTLSRADGEPVAITRVIAVDRVQPAALFLDPRIEYVRGDYELPRFLARMMGTITDSVFHLSALGAGLDEAGRPADLEAALLGSVDTTRALLDACGFQSAPPKLVFASAMQARMDGGRLPAGTDGVCAALCELLLIECHRRAIIDLRCVRLPCLVGDRSTAQAILLEKLLAPYAMHAPQADASARTPFPVLHLSRAASALVQAHELAYSATEAERVMDEPGAQERLADLLSAPAQ